MNNLINKKVLITAGPTWVAIDKVRVITNVFSGELGLLIAREFYKQGAKTTLFFGPGRRELIHPEKDKFEIKYFRYYDELLSLLEKEAKEYDIIVHSAAVSDYKPIKASEGKIKSGAKNLAIRFKPTIKLIDLIRKINPKAVLVKFKLEVDISKKELIQKARESMLFSKADFMVANDLSSITKTSHKAYIIDKNKTIIFCQTKQKTAKTLVNIIKKSIKP